MAKLRRPRRQRKPKTQRGDDGLETAVTVVEKPELGQRVRLIHRAGGGEYAFDYPPAVALQLARDVMAAAGHADKLGRELERRV